MNIKLFRSLKIIVLVSVFGIVFYFALLNLFSFSDVSRIGNDSIDFILPALAPKLGLGVPYRDYFENNPPGILLLTWGWSEAFGFSNLSFKILHFLTLISSPILFYFLTKKLFSWPIRLLLVIFSSVVLFSPKLNTFLLTSEQIGLVFSLLGLVFLVRLDDSKIFWRYFLASFFLFFAAQMKDPFGPAVICLLPPVVYYLIKKDLGSFLKASLSIFLGVASVFFVIVIYLNVMGSFGAYLELLGLKAEIYHGNFDPGFLMGTLSSMIQHVKSLVIFLQYSWLLLLFILLMSWVVNKLSLKEIILEKTRLRKNQVYLAIKTRIEINEELIIFFALIFYVVGNFFGFEIQGVFGSHYLIQMVVPIYIFLTIILLVLYRSVNSLIHFLPEFFKKNSVMVFKIFSVIFFCLLLFPKYLRSYPYREFNVNTFYENLVKSQKNPSFETYIRQNTEPTDCILSVYGWGTPATNFYSKRKPCTRFYITNLVSDEHKMEYQEQILQNPPSMILYNIGGADMDVERFERNTFNLGKVVEKCYKKDLNYENLYLPSMSSEQLLECLKKHGMVNKL